MTVHASLASLVALAQRHTCIFSLTVHPFYLEVAYTLPDERPQVIRGDDFDALLRELFDRLDVLHGLRANEEHPRG